MKKPTQLNSANGMPSKGAPCASRVERGDDDGANPRAALTKASSTGESDRTLNHCATKAEAAKLKTWMVGCGWWLC